MKKNNNLENLYILLFFIISIVFTIFFVGLNNIWFSNTNWLYGAGDLTNAQLGWQYFHHDKWHFPIGKNPNYGLEISNSIVFTDNIPLFAIFFKIFGSLLYEKFQYFSLWIFLCLFLQLYFAYLILKKATKNKFISFLTSFLFLLSPFMFYRLTYHFSLGGHWLLLYTFYIAYFIKEKDKSHHWYILIALSLLIHLYFTLMIFVIYSCFLLEEIVRKKNYTLSLRLFYKITFAIIIMFVIGYFESSPINSVSSGYGEYKLDLLSFFDPKVSTTLTWSTFLKDLRGTHLEGFNYIGLGNIILIIFGIFIFLKNLIKKKSSNFPISILRISSLYIIIFFLWAITTNISIMGNEIISIRLPNYLFGIMSIFSSTGRFAWPVIYIIIFFTIIFLFKNFKNSNITMIMVVIIMIQIIDVSKGIKNNSFSNKGETQNFDQIWNVIENENYEKIRTTYLYHNYGPIFSDLSKILGNLKNIKTDIILNASMDREKAAKVRYELIENIISERVDEKTVYIVDNHGHLKYLKNKFDEKDYGFFLRDNLWIMIPNKKRDMNKKDIKNFKNIEFDNIKLNKNYDLNFKGNFLSFGWSHNFGSSGTWTEGPNSFLLLKIPEIDKKVKLIVNLKPYKSNNKDNYNLELLVNEKSYKKVNFHDNKKAQQISIDLDKNLSKRTIIHFKLSGLISPYDILESPDARKLGVLVSSIELREDK